MKKVIKWLAEISGVEQQIRDNERSRIGGEFDSASYWFVDYVKYPYMYPLMKFFADKLKTKHYIRGDFSRDWMDREMAHDPQISMHLQKIEDLKQNYKHHETPLP